MQDRDDKIIETLDWIIEIVEELKQEIKQEGQGKRILVFDGKRYGCKSYEDCWFKCLVLLSEKCGADFDDVLKIKVREQQSTSYFSKKRAEIARRSSYYTVSKIPGTDIYARISFHVPTLRKLVKSYAKHFGHKAKIE